MLRLIVGSLGLVALALTQVVSAQDAWPNRPLRIVVPFPPGGGVDVVTRLVSNRLQESLKQPVVVDNRPGANTIVGAEHVAKQPADGYTILAAIDGTLSQNQALYQKLPYDPIADFAPITLATSQPMVLAAHPSVAAKDLSELIGQLRGGAKLAYAHAPVPAQLAGELFKSMAKVELQSVPYKGGAQAVQDTLAGVVPLIFDLPSNVIGHVHAGKLKAFAVTSTQRSSVMPDVPTFAESGLAGYELSTWVGYVAPAKTPREIVQRLHNELVRAFNAPEVRERLNGLGIRWIGAGPDEFSKTIRDDAVKFTRIIREANIKFD